VADAREALGDLGDPGTMSISTTHVWTGPEGRVAAAKTCTRRLLSALGLVAFGY